MDWYYAQDGRPSGPVSDTEFTGLVARGVVTNQTLVWHAGLANWEPFGRLAPQMAANAATPGVPPGDAVALRSGPVVCAECGGVFPQDQTIPFGAVWVCAGCKPAFVQKLKEGVASVTVGSLRYAGFWIRFAAKFIDGLLLTVVVVLPLAFLMGLMAVRTQQSDAFSWAAIGMQLLLQIGYVAVAVTYNTFFIGRYGATLGKMAVGLRVVTAEGAPPTMKRALGRACAEQLSSLTCNLGYLIAAFDDQKRTLHDYLCNTRVVLK